MTIKFNLLEMISTYFQTPRPKTLRSPLGVSKSTLISENWSSYAPKIRSIIHFFAWIDRKPCNFFLIQWIVHMTRILSKPSDFMLESYAWCFKDAEKIGFGKSAKNSQSPPTPCMWWRGFKQLYISLWSLTTTCEEVLQHYSDTQR